MGEVQYCCLYRSYLLENLQQFTKIPNRWFKKQALYAQGPFNKERHVMFSRKCNSISVKRETPFICSKDPWSYSKRHQILAFLLLGWPSGPQSQISTLWKIVEKKRKWNRSVSDIGDVINNEDDDKSGEVVDKLTKLSRGRALNG